MKQWKLKHLAFAAMVATAAVGLAGCEAQGDGSLDGIDDGDGVLFPNDGSTFTRVTEDGTPINVGERFICDAGASDVSNDLETRVVTLGLIGGPVANLLDALGADPVNGVTGSVTDKDNVIDNDLTTFATFRRAVDLVGTLTTVDEVVRFNTQVSDGHYAVFAVSFPAGVLEASLVNRIVIHTFRDHVLQETTALTQAVAVDLLGLPLVNGVRRAFIGLKTTQDFDAVTVGTVPLLAANVGDSLRVHELCTDGHFVSAPGT